MKLGDAVTVVGVTGTVVATRQDATFTPAGELAGMTTRFFVQTGACSAGRLGAWVAANGTPLSDEVDVLPYA